MSFKTIYAKYYSFLYISIYCIAFVLIVLYIFYILKNKGINMIKNIQTKDATQDVAASKIQSLVRGGLVRIKKQRQDGTIPVVSFAAVGESLIKKQQQDETIPAVSFAAVGEALSDKDADKKPAYDLGVSVATLSSELKNMNFLHGKGSEHLAWTQSHFKPISSVASSSSLSSAS
jgi:hypothetical protein